MNKAHNYYYFLLLFLSMPDPHFLDIAIDYDVSKLLGEPIVAQIGFYKNRKSVTSHQSILHQKIAIPLFSLSLRSLWLYAFEALWFFFSSRFFLRLSFHVLYLIVSRSKFAKSQTGAMYRSLLTRNGCQINTLHFPCSVSDMSRW